jgi:nucleotide-binding universal stress UspA family protein
MSILYPTDFSNESAKAFQVALELAKKTNDSITLLHVYGVPLPLTGFDDPRGIDMTDEMMAAQEQAMEDRMKLFKDELKDRYNNYSSEMVRVSGVLRMGYKGPEVIHTAEEMHASYIVMEVKHFNKKRNFLFGNTTTHILGKSKVPVVTVPEGFQFNGIKKIGYATDLTFNDNAVIARLLDLAAIFDAQVKCFHVHDSNLDTENSIIDDFIERYKPEANAGRISFQLVDNLNTVDGIEYYIKENDIDLLAVVKEKKYWLDLFDTSITKQLAFHAKVLLLVYHE